MQTRLHPLPTALSAAVCAFETVHDAASAASLLLQLGIPVARCELLDAATIAAFNAYAKEVRGEDQRRGGGAWRGGVELRERERERKKEISGRGASTRAQPIRAG